MTWREAAPKRNWRRVLAAIALVMALVSVACSGADSTDVASGPDIAPEPTTSPTAEPSALPTTSAVAAPTGVPTPTSIAIPVPTPEFGPTGRPTEAGTVQVLTAKAVVSRPTVYDTPDGAVIGIPYQYLDGRVDPTYDWFVNPTFYGSKLAMRVLTGEPGDDWAEIQIPTRPIMTGWIQTADYTWSDSNFYVLVNLGNNTVTVWEGDKVIVDSTSVVTGDTGRETPLTSTYVDEILPGPSSAYGPWLLSLGVFSDAINTFGSNAGLPKVALHGTNRPDLLGQYASNGCIRLPNEIIADLADRVPVGTRVDIINEA